MRCIKLFFGLALMLLPLLASAVVGRHDRPAEAYRLEHAPRYLVDMPHEGSGVLIHPEWVLSAAHTVFYDYADKDITIQGQNNTITEVVFHPEYEKPDESLFAGDAAPIQRFLHSRSDLVLLRLASPVTQVQPIKLYAGNEEVGMRFTGYGRGAAGNGETGEDLDSKQARTLRRYENTIEGADERWLTYRFDADGLALEGMLGSGDSGGPAVAIIDGEPTLIGIASWLQYQGDLEDFLGGRYGMVAVLQRVSRYQAWLEAVIAAD